MQSYTEIPLSELTQYSNNFREALLAVCESPAFRTSPKSCEFLRHIVHQSLTGNTDELKERLIGMSLLGREASYDTGSDAGVRVRANDVRKRLAAYNSVKTEVGRFTFDLPTGSYVPRFFREVTLPLPARAKAIADHPEMHDIDTPLPLQRLAAPTFVALFLCVICLRWQIAQEHPFTTFWQSVFQGHNVRLYLPLTENDGGHQLVAMQEIQASVPLVNLAGQFHSQLNLTGDAVARADEFLISISPVSEMRAEIKPPLATAANRLLPLDTNRLTVMNTPGGRKIFDQSASKPFPASGGSAALLTISNGPSHSIRIDGTDDASVNALIRLLCERDTFPEGLADSVAEGTVTQVVFPMAPHSLPTIFRNLSAVTQMNTDKAQ
jgi:hypothetical protein